MAASAGSRPRALLAGFVTFGVLGALACDRSPEREQLAPEVAAGLDSRRGEVISFGSVFLEVEEPGHLRIVDVSVATASNTHFAGAAVTLEADNPPGEGWSMTDSGFPPPAALGGDARGLEVSAEDLRASAARPSRVQVTIGLEVLTGSIGGMNGIDVIYEVGEIRYHEHFAHALLICVEPRSCAAADTEGELAALGLL